MTGYTGPGKYDDVCSYVREQAQAETVILMIINGNRGTGFSVQTHMADATEVLPQLLENIAADLRNAQAPVNDDYMLPHRSE